MTYIKDFITFFVFAVVLVLIGLQHNELNQSLSSSYMGLRIAMILCAVMAFMYVIHLVGLALIEAQELYKQIEEDEDHWNQREQDYFWEKYDYD